MWLGVLGPVQCAVIETPVKVAGGLNRALLAALAVDNARMTGIDELVDALWGEQPPAAAEKVVRNRVSLLRGLLTAAFIETVGSGYRLGPAVSVDTHEFENAGRAVVDRLGLWRGSPFEEIAEWPPARVAGVRLNELRAHLEEVSIVEQLDWGVDPSLLVGPVEQLVESEPYRERRWALLMRTLYLAGRQHDALLAFQRARDLLLEELGLSPGAELLAVERSILNQEPSLAPQPSAVQITRPSAMTNLPVRPTGLIGRDEDVARVRKLLAEHRLVTVTAIGGSGKTRIAIAVGEAELPHRSGGVWFADLAAVTSDSEVPGAMSRAVGLSLRDGDQIAQVVDHLADKQALVILDNCEHVIGGCAEFADRFLTTAGESVLLATSREALTVDGECTMLLSPLAADGTDAPAVRLFSERAAAADTRFVVDDTNGETVAAICRRLDGIPLAIELAAARITMMTLPELEAGLNDRFALLAGSRPRQRHRTLQGTLDWSFDLLRDNEQHALRTLGTFFGGFDIDAVAEVAGMQRAAAFAAVEALTSKSLVMRVDGGLRARFGLLETVKAYAEDHLAAAGETVEARDRHLDHFHSLATVHGHTGISELRLGVALRPERSNLTAAFEWAVTTGRWELAGELIAGSYPAYIFDGAALEARHLIQRALAGPGVRDTSLTDQLHAALVMTTAWLTDWATYGEAAGELTRSATTVMRALGFIALGVSTPFADAETSHAHLDQAQIELAAAKATSPDLLCDVVAALIHWVEGRVAAGHGDFQAGLEGSRAFLAKCSAIDYYPTPTPRAAKHAAACQILLGDPASAIDTVAWLENFDVSTFNTDDIRSLALLAQDRLSDAVPVVHAHAKRGLTGRMPGQVCDSVLLLAALANAEGDAGRASDLLRHMGAGLEPGVIIMSRHLADRLGIATEHTDLQRRALTYDDSDREGFNGTRMASGAVRDELARRGWH